LSVCLFSYGAGLMLRDLITSSNLIRFGHTVATDLGPSISVLVSILAVGAWLLGVTIEAQPTGVLDQNDWSQKGSNQRPAHVSFNG
jgi:hypothetical protein